MSEPSANCIGCGTIQPIVEGRIAPHGTPPCSLSGAVPWRSGVPDQDTVVRHLQLHSATGEIEAYFQVREGLVCPAIVVASFDRNDRLVWGYAIPVLDLTQAPAHAARIEPNHLWLARPIDIHTHEARPWIDP